MLVEGKAIRIHPLVCTAFNADFDGDQMAVHIPLSPEAQIEASVLMMSSNNILSPASGQPIAIPSQDIVLGCYYLTKSKAGRQGRRPGVRVARRRAAGARGGRGGDAVADPAALHRPADRPDRRARLAGRARRGRDSTVDGRIINTTVGRVIFNNALPKEMPFINGLLKKKGLQQAVRYCYLKHGLEKTVEMLDSLKNLGFTYATQSGISIGIDDLIIPEKKAEFVQNARDEVIKVEGQYQDGAITNGERNNKVIAIWSEVTEKIADEMFGEMEGLDKSGKSFNPVYIMADSGARGSKQQIRQLAGMRGLMAKPSGEIIETPITSNFREGLTVLQYFISTHGARKGLADTALKTADSGYLTRRLVDVAQDVIISEIDCGTLDGIEARPIVDSGGEIVERLSDRIIGRVALDDIVDPSSGEVIVPAAGEFDEAAGRRGRGRGHRARQDPLGADVRGAPRRVREVLRPRPGDRTARRARPGGRRHRRAVDRRARHAADDADVPHRRHGVARLRAVDARDAPQRHGPVRRPVAVEGREQKDGGRRRRSLIVMNRSGSINIVDDKGVVRERYSVVYGAHLKVRDGEHVEKGQILVEWDPYTFSILTEGGGTVRFKDIIDKVTVHEDVDEVTGLSRLIIVDSPDEKKQPAIEIVGPDGKVVHKYHMPSNAHLMVAQRRARCSPATCSRRFRAKRRRPRTSRAVCRAWSSSSRRASRARRPSSPKSTAPSATAASSRACARSSSSPTMAREAREYSLPRGVHVNVQEGDRVRAGEPLMDGPRNPHDILAVLGEKELQALPGQRDPGGLPAAGRRHQRQAHRGHRPADDAVGEGRGSGRHRVPDRGAGGQVPLPGRERARARATAACRRRAGRCCSASRRRRSRPTRSSRRRRSRRRRAC